MSRLVPIAGFDFSFGQFVRSCVCAAGARRDVAAMFEALYKPAYSICANSGLSCFFLALEACKRCRRGTEVILPAYTAGSLVVAVRTAGLCPVLCDISLEDFSFDVQNLRRVVSEKTLCIVGVHALGIPGDIAGIRRACPDIFILEDCAQSMGSRIGETLVGGAGDISFFSFNRGKNIPAAGGGYVMVFRAELADALSDVVKKYNLSSRTGLREAINMAALSLIVQPHIYGVVHKALAAFRETTYPDDVHVLGWSDAQASFARALYAAEKQASRLRYAHGQMLGKALQGAGGIRVPVVRAGVEPAFNRFPIFVEGTERLERVQENLFAAGYESSRLYGKPLHQMFDMGYARGTFPRAEYIAAHLVTLPCHTLVRPEDIAAMAACIRKP